MSTGLIIAIAIVVLIIIALVVMLPKMRERSELRARERELAQRREQVSAEHREQAEVSESRADEAERRARIARQEAEVERAQAQLHEERAELHARGQADDELIEEHERDRFAGTSAVADRDPADRDRTAGLDDAGHERMAHDDGFDGPATRDAGHDGDYAGLRDDEPGRGSRRL